MYRCECKNEFENTRQIEEEGGIFNVCPECLGTDYYTIYKCSVCGDWFYPWEINGNVCYECAKKMYTDRLGLSYIEQHKVEFYIWYLWGIVKMDKDLEKNLADILEKHFLENLDMDTENFNLTEVKKFSLSNLDEWIDFLREEGEV